MRANLAGLKYICDEIARVIQSTESSAIFLLVGDIGAGKTTLVREFAEYVGIKESVTSPTFSLLHIYSAGNSPLGLHSADFANLGHCADFSLALRPKFAKNHESQTENPSVVDSTRDAEFSEKIKSKKPFKSFCYFWLLPKVESPIPSNPNLPNNADSAESQNLNKNNPRVSANLESRPLRGAKNRNQASSSASADFLLEAEKRGTPPKSEKAELFGAQGERGGGCSPFCEKEKDSNENAESKRDSSPTAQNDKIMDCHADSANLLAMTKNVESAESTLDSANLQNLTIYHYDLYQKGVDYALDLGLLDLLEQRGIHFVEWGDRRLFEIIKDAFENIFILQITKAKNDRIYELKREF